MGLFSFSKGSGAKTLKKEEEAKAAAISQAEVNRLKINKMTADVNELNLPVTNLSILINDDVVTVYGEAETQVAKELVVLTVGNNMGISSVDDRMSVVEPEPEEATFYEVKSGDSLSKIAKAHYGDANKYNAIFEANKPMLKDPNLIYPGQMLRIPQL